MKFTSVKEHHLFLKAYSKGKRQVQPSVAVYVLPDYKKEEFRKNRRDQKYINRIGLTTTKKLGGAVVRARCRRIMREAYHAVDKAYGVKPGHLLIFVARENATKIKSTELEKEFLVAFRKLNLLMR